MDKSDFQRGKMTYIDGIKAYRPANEQEANDKKLILEYISHFPNSVLTRENEIAHITSSGFVMNKTLDRVLLVHHNIRGVWAWTGGHADADDDLLAVALREAREETGLVDVRPLDGHIASLDILVNYGHLRRGHYVSAHLHLSVAYILVADEGEKLSVQPEENTAVKWFPVEYFSEENFSPGDVYLYGKLIQRAKKGKGQ